MNVNIIWVFRVAWKPSLWITPYAPASPIYPKPKMSMVPQDDEHHLRGFIHAHYKRGKVKGAIRLACSGNATAGFHLLSLLDKYLPLHRDSSVPPPLQAQPNLDVWLSRPYIESFSHWSAWVGHLMARVLKTSWIWQIQWHSLSFKNEILFVGAFKCMSKLIVVYYSSKFLVWGNYRNQLSMHYCKIH